MKKKKLKKRIAGLEHKIGTLRKDVVELCEDYDSPKSIIIRSRHEFAKAYDTMILRMSELTFNNQ